MRRHLVPCGGGGLRPAALAGVLVALLVGADVAAAHTKLVRTATSARAVALTFSTPVSPRLTRIDVLAAAGGDIEPGEPRNAPGDPATVVLPIRGELRGGRHFVTWSTANDDGHVVNGVFDFDVRRAPGAAATRVRSAPAVREAPEAVAGLLSLARIAQDAALTLAFGLVVFLALVWRRLTVDGAAPAGREVAATTAVDAAVRARLRSLLVAAAAVGAVSAGAAVALQSAVVAGGVPWDGSAVAALPDVLASRSGACWAILTLVWLALVAAARRRLGGRLLLGLAVALVVSPPLRGHGGDGPLGLAVVVHVAAAGAWVGGLVALLVAAHAARAVLGLRERTALFATIVSRFAVIAVPCAVAVLATGILQAVGALDAPGQLATESYGRFVAAKVVLFTAILALAARARGALVERLWHADGARAAAAMRTTIAVELTLAMGALTAAGTMASTAPPG